MAYESEVMHELEDEYSGEGEEELEGELEDESSLEGEGWLGAIGNVVGSLMGEGEGEDEFEDESSFEGEDEAEVSPIRKIYPDAMMEHLGELAFEAESEDEAAEHFLPLIGMAASKLLPVVAKAVAPMARRALPKIAGAVTRATPRLTKGIGQIARTLHRNPQTRSLLKTVPAIARRTVSSIARQVAHGKHITPRSAIRTLAKQTSRVLGHPHHRRHALRHHNHLERKFHRRHAHGMARPHWRWRNGRYHPRYGWQGYRGQAAGPGYAPAAGGGQVTSHPGAAYSGAAHPADPYSAGQGATPRPGGPRVGRGQGTAHTNFCTCCGQAIR